MFTQSLVNIIGNSHVITTVFQALQKINVIIIFHVDDVGLEPTTPSV